MHGNWISLSGDVRGNFQQAAKAGVDNEAQMGNRINIRNPLERTDQ